MMSVSNYDELLDHIGHELQCVKYGDVSTSIECKDCNEVLVEYERDDFNDFVHSHDINGVIAGAIWDHADNKDMSSIELANRVNFVIKSLGDIDTFYELIKEIMTYYKEDRGK